jgi:hypothetical protein
MIDTDGLGILSKEQFRTGCAGTSLFPKADQIFDAVDKGVMGKITGQQFIDEMMSNLCVAQYSVPALIFVPRFKSVGSHVALVCIAVSRELWLTQMRSGWLMI